jgi:hypothetical protein
MRLFAKQLLLPGVRVMRLLDPVALGACHSGWQQLFSINTWQQWELQLARKL